MEMSSVWFLAGILALNYIIRATGASGSMDTMHVSRWSAHDDLTRAGLAVSRIFRTILGGFVRTMVIDNLKVK